MGSKPLEQVQQEAMEFLTTRAGFAQVYTINRDGYPTGRTMGAPIAPDWTVRLIQGRRGYDRVNQVRANPRVEILWIDTKSDQVVPKAVFLRGNAELFEGDELVRVYNERWEWLAAQGRAHGERRSPEDVRASLIGIKVNPVRIRVEGFGQQAEVFSWRPAL